MIELRGVTKSYGTKPAVSELDLHVRRGEVFALLGANGAGKTTTIKMLVSLLMPDHGTLRIGPYDVLRQPREASRLVGYVPDQPFLYDKLSGREFLEFIADVYGMDPAEARDSLAEQIQVFGLADFVEHLTETYSHGMKQRIVFAAAFIHRPQVVILDEPMVGLDPQSMRVVKDLLRRQAAAGTTVFMSTHTLPLAEEIAHRIGVFKTGRLQFVGTVSELRQQWQRQDASLERIFLELTASAEPDSQR